uniref:Uncharacterized protein n=2 Tax=Eptatretus burgeri TaxID=7764 RepID=A0A8C4NEP6_EPTBU
MAEHGELLAEIPLLLRLPPGKRRAQAIERRRLQLQRWNDWDHELAFEKDACIVDPQSATNLRDGPALCVRFSSAECLVEATARGNTAEVLKLLDNGVDAHQQNAQGLTMLHQACLSGSKELVEDLLDTGADIDVRDSGQWTPLHVAAASGHTGVVFLLVERGAQLLAVSSEDELAIDVCSVENTRLGLLHLMKEHGVTEEDKELARCKRKEMIVQKLEEIIDSGENLKSDSQCATLLHVTACYGLLSLTQLLLEKGDDPNAADEDGWAPLHAAAYWGQDDVAGLLLKNGADWECKTNLWETPLDLCPDDKSRRRFLNLHSNEMDKNGPQHLVKRSTWRGSKGKISSFGRVEVDGQAARCLPGEGFNWKFTQEGLPGDDGVVSSKNSDSWPLHNKDRRQSDGLLNIPSAVKCKRRFSISEPMSDFLKKILLNAEMNTSPTLVKSVAISNEAFTEAPEENQNCDLNDMEKANDPVTVQSTMECELHSGKINGVITQELKPTLPSSTNDGTPESDSESLDKISNNKSENVGDCICCYCCTCKVM